MIIWWKGIARNDNTVGSCTKYNSKVMIIGLLVSISIKETNTEEIFLILWLSVTNHARTPCFWFWTCPNFGGHDLMFSWSFGSGVAVNWWGYVWWVDWCVVEDHQCYFTWTIRGSGYHGQSMIIIAKASKKRCHGLSFPHWSLTITNSRFLSA